MIKRLLLAVSLVVACSSARAYDLVYDPVNHMQNLVDEVANMVKWAATQVSAAQTQLNTLNSYEQTVLQVERMGDPKALTANLPGVSNLQTLAQIYAQANKDITDWSAYVNPKSWQMTTNQILSLYQQPALTTFTASNGVRVGTAQSLVQFQTANYNTAASAQQRVATLNQQLQTLTQQLAAATSGMQSATTQAQVQKYQASISALHASIDATKAALQEAEFSQQLQTQQNNAAQQISRAAQAQATEASDLQNIDQGLNGLPLGNFSQPQLWNANP
jgi:DNA repair exonuclease SbcCD ATPase subunit